MSHPASAMLITIERPTSATREKTISPVLTAYAESDRDLSLLINNNCDFKISPGCNSGIFFRVGDLKDPVQSGFEIQIYDTANKKTKPGKNDGGALYDAVAPSVNAMKPAGEWDHIEITADKSLVLAQADVGRHLRRHRLTH